ncbi:hypothetical protein L2U69_18580 [Zavarzinia compransoris]|nr:hypothetical protein [Zavarzinia marina]MCF4167658.1 hypothetical protein [Zavarzinia marina]
MGNPVSGEAFRLIVSLGLRAGEFFYIDGPGVQAPQAFFRKGEAGDA